MANVCLPVAVSSALVLSLGLTLYFVPYVSSVTCTISQYDKSIIDAVQRECSEIIIDGMTVPAGVTLDLTKLQDGTKLIFQGRITWGYAEWKGPLLTIKGTNVEVVGANNHVLDGRGALWWDYLGENSGKVKPHFLKVSVEDSLIHNVYIKNTPVQVFSLSGCTNSEVQNVTVDNKDGFDRGGRDTDGFDVNSNHNITIRDCTVHNQGDCMAINSGYDTYFINNYCSGGRGISVGPVGDGATVQGVTVSDCQIFNSDDGVGIKTKYGETGSVTNVIYENIELKGIHYHGIMIHGDYGSTGGIPTGGVPITNLVLKNIHGLVERTGQNVFIRVKNAANWHSSEINIIGGHYNMECVGVPSGSGISC